MPVLDVLAAITVCLLLCPIAAGDQVGVELDDAHGNCDGSVDGIRYFRCQPNHGVFVEASHLQPGT